MLASYAPAVSFETLDDALAVLRERGLRISTARRLVLEALFEADGPVSADQLSRRLELDVASVYRNLETLERCGLAAHLHLGHGPSLHVLVGRGEREYLYCEGCGAVATLAPEALERVRAEVRRGFGYEARFTHFPIVGLCPKCAASPPARR